MVQLQLIIDYDKTHMKYNQRFVIDWLQKAVAWDMLRVYNDFIEAQERRRLVEISLLD